MIRRVLMFLASPVFVLAAQVAPLHVTITAANNTAFRVVRSSDSTAQTRFGQGRWEIMTDSAAASTREVVAVIAQDSADPVHVEAREGEQLVASGEGAFVTVRREAGTVFIESRSRAPSSLHPADLRKP
jgi:hypothetical protein